eukprot:5096396-Lingulodinium_polyedra.AAC.1
MKDPKTDGLDKIPERERSDKDDQATLETFFGKFQDLCREGPYANCLKQALQDYGKPPVAARCGHQG